MASRYTILAEGAPLKGAFIDLHPAEIPEGGASLVDGYRIAKNRLVSYGGWSSWLPDFDSEEEELNFGFDFELPGGQRKFVFGGSKHLYVENHTGVVTQLNSNPFSGQGFRWSYTIMKESLVLANGVEPLQIYNGSSLTSVPKIGRYVENVANHLVLAYPFDTEYFGRRILWSHLDDFTVWDGLDTEAGWFDFPSDIGEIRGLKNLGPNSCLVYGSSAIYSMSYIGLPLIFRFERVLSLEGLLAPYSLVGSSDMHFFIGNRDFYTISPGTSLRPIGLGRVRDYFFGLFDQSNKEKVYGFVHPNFPEVWWVFKDKTNTGRALCYNWESDAWTSRGLSSSFNFSFLAAYLDLQERTIAQATNPIFEATVSWRDKKGKGKWVVLGAK